MAQSLKELYYKTHDKPDGGVTAVGIGEAAISMGTGMVGAFAGTLAGAMNALRERDLFAFTPAFEAVAAETNKAVQYDPKTKGGDAAVQAFEELWTEYISDPTEKYLVQPNIVEGNPLMAAIGKASGEGLAMFGMLKAGVPVKATAKGLMSLSQKIVQKVRGKEPGAKEVLVDMETGEPVITPDMPLSDKGVSMEGLREFVSLSKRPTVAPHEGIGAILKPLFYKPVQVLRDWKSPALNKMADYIYAPTKADATIKTPRGVDLIDAQSKSMGKFAVALDKILEPHKGRVGVKKKAGEAIVRGLRTGKVPKEFREASLQVKDFLDGFLENYVRPVLPETGTVENYFPQVWDVGKIQGSPKRFASFLEERLGYDATASENFIRRVIEGEGSPEMEMVSDRLLKPSDAKAWAGRIRDPGYASRSKFLEKTRRVHLTEEQLPFAEGWLLNDLPSVMFTYLRNATRRVEYARTMGANEGKLNSTVAKAIDELGIGENQNAIGQLTGDIYGLADALQGKYNPIKSISGAKWNRRLANYETVLHLGLVSLASFPEMVAPAIQFGLIPKAYAKGVLHAVLEATASAERLITGKRRIPKLESAEALESLGAISLTALQSSQAARFSTVGNTFTSRFMHATGLELLTDAQRVIAYETISTILKRNAKAIAKGKEKPFYENQLIELGVSKQDAIAWHKQGYPKQGYLADKFENAKLRGQRWAITTPTAATKPLLFSDPHWANILLFKSFNSVFSNLFMKRALKEIMTAPTSRKAGVVGNMAAAVGIAYYTQFLRDLITGRRNQKDSVQRSLDAIDRAALTGPFTYAYSLASPYRYGFTDSSAKRLFNLAGPAINDVAKLMDAIMNSDMSRKKKAEAIAKLVPITGITKGGREATADVIEGFL